jgi:hypothetical protein
LPEGGALDPVMIERFSDRLKALLQRAKWLGRVTMTEECRKRWRQIYEELSVDHPGLLGSIIARAEAQTIPLALIYAVLEERPEGETAMIEVVHLEAAYAVWKFCETSARYIFGDLLGDPVADEILRALRAAGQAGMTRWAISEMFSRNRSSSQIGAALAALQRLGRVRSLFVVGPAGGRPSETWYAVAS